MVEIKGGGKFEAALQAIAVNVTKAATVRIGFLEGSSYPDGTSVPLVAAIQEFGAPARNIPPRPFFRQTIAEHSDEWGSAIANLLKANDYDAEKTLALTGAGIKGQLQQSIADFSGVPLSEATIKAKGNEKQLVDTGHMLNSVDFAVSTNRADED